MADNTNQSQSGPMKRNQRQTIQLGETLVQRGILTRDQLTDVLEAKANRYGDKPLVDILVELRAASKKDVLSALAATVGLPFVTLSAKMVRPGAMEALPREFCENANILPLSSVDGWLTVAAADFTNLFLIEQIQKIANQQVQIVAADEENIRQVRAEALKIKTPVGKSGSDSGSLDHLGLDELTVVNESKQDAQEEAETRDLETAASGSPTIRLVNHIIKTAVEAGASDIHIEPDEKEFQIRYRVDGDLVVEALRPSIRLLPAVVSRIKIMAQMDISERRLPQDGAITVVLQNHSIELRVSTMATTFGEKVVIRIVDNSTGVRKLEELGFTPSVLRDFRKAIHAANGIVLVTGPTGSGKSTTLYSALAEIASPIINISSIEDPVEFHLKGINQFQANAKTGFTFAKAMRSMLRQDPDVVMVGEIRDSETSKLAIEAALTGHLVLSTLHTNDAPSSIPRLVNMGTEPYLVAASLRAVLAQRLVKRLCPECREKMPMKPGLKNALSQKLCGPVPEFAYDARGCGRCHHSGRMGRTGVHEIILADGGNAAEPGK